MKFEIPGINHVKFTQHARPQPALRQLATGNRFKNPCVVCNLELRTSNFKHYSTSTGHSETGNWQPVTDIPYRLEFN